MDDTTQCPQCGRTYHRSSCEFCQRRDFWQDRIRDREVHNLQLSARIRADLRDITIPDQQVDHSVALLRKHHHLFLTGPANSGKTLLSIHIALRDMRQRYIENKWRPWRFVSVPDLLMELRQSFQADAPESEYDIIQKYRQQTGVILDDFGAEKTSQWVLQAMYLIINHRYEYLQPTIFTSNLNLDQLADALNDDRIPSRIARMASVQYIHWQEFAHQHQNESEDV